MTAPLPTVTRAGDADREHTADLLGLALAQGYLAMADYERRVSSAFAAGTRDELRALTGDLPVALLRRRDPRQREAMQRAARASVRLHLGAYLAGSLLMVGIWLAVGLGGGGWYFWPVWPIMGWGIGVLGHALPVRSAFPGAAVGR